MSTVLYRLYSGINERPAWHKKILLSGHCLGHWLCPEIRRAALPTRTTKKCKRHYLFPNHTMTPKKYKISLSPNHTHDTCTQIVNFTGGACEETFVFRSLHFQPERLSARADEVNLVGLLRWPRRDRNCSFSPLPSQPSTADGVFSQRRATKIQYRADTESFACASPP